MFLRKKSNMNKQIIKVVLNSSIVLALLATLTTTASAKFSTTPDAASTSALTGIACCGLIAVRRFLRK
jgi:hypothetical protein